MTCVLAPPQQTQGPLSRQAPGNSLCCCLKCGMRGGRARPLVTPATRRPLDE